jgi:tRNA-dihydrouridine synthase 4
MSARGILQNPALFAGYEACPWEAVELFMNKVAKAPIPFKLVVHHVSEMVGSDRAGGQVGGGAGPLLTKEQRMEMMECKTMLDLMDLLDSIRELKRL